MKERNSMDVDEFLKYHLFWIVCGGIWYWSLLYHNLPGRGAVFSGLLLGALVVGCSLWGIFHQWEYRRNTLSIWGNLAVGCGIYTALCYLTVRPVLIRRLVAATVAVGALRAALVRLRPVRARTRARFRRLCRLRRQQAVNTLYNTLALGMLAVMVLLLVLAPRNGGMLGATVEPTNALQNGEQTIQANREQLLLLQQDQWQTLTLQQRLDVLQTAANIEQSALGLPHPLWVVTDDMDELLRGYYEDDTRHIVISLQELKSCPAQDLLVAVCHEAYHGYEHYLVDRYAQASPEERALPVYDPVPGYEQEFENYISGEDDLEGYYRQTCEADARAYSEARAADYRAALWQTDREE